MASDASTIAAWAAVAAAGGGLVYPPVSAYFKRPRVKVEVQNGTMRSTRISSAFGPLETPQTRTVGGGLIHTVRVDVTGRQAVTIRAWGVQQDGDEVDGASINGGPKLPLRLGSNDAASWTFAVGELRRVARTKPSEFIRVYVLPAGRRRRATSDHLLVPRS